MSAVGIFPSRFASRSVLVLVGIDIVLFGLFFWYKHQYQKFEKDIIPHLEKQLKTFLAEEAKDIRVLSLYPLDISWYPATLESMYSFCPMGEDFWSKEGGVMHNLWGKYVVDIATSGDKPLTLLRRDDYSTKEGAGQVRITWLRPDGVEQTICRCYFF